MKPRLLTSEFVAAGRINAGHNPGPDRKPNLKKKRTAPLSVRVSKEQRAELERRAVGTSLNQSKT